MMVRRMGCLFVAMGVLAGPAFAEEQAPKLEKPGRVIIDTVKTNGPGMNRPWKLFTGQPWRAKLNLETLEFSFNKTTRIKGLTVARCRPPDDDVELVAKLLTEDGWVELEEDDGERTLPLYLDEPVAASWLRIIVADAGECIAGLTVLGPDDKPLEVFAVEPVLGSVTSTRPMAGYEPHKMFDGDFTTAWSSEGDGTGTELTFEFTQPRWLTDIYLWPGYHRSEKLWKQNSAPTKVTVLIEGEAPQTFDIPEAMDPGHEPRMQLKRRTQASKVVLRIDAVRRGTKYPDTLISELRFVNDFRPFVPDPTPAYLAHAKATRAALKPPGLDRFVGELLVSPDEESWYLGFFGDGRFFLKRYASGGDYYESALSYEVKKVTMKQATLRVYGSVDHVPVVEDEAQWDKLETKTINGRLIVKPSGAGVTLELQGKYAKFLPLPKGHYRISEPWVDEKDQQLKAKGFPALRGYGFVMGEVRAEFSGSRINFSGHVPGDDAHYYAAFMTGKQTSLSDGRIEYELSGPVEKFVKRNDEGRLGKRFYRTESTGRLVVEATDDGVKLTPSGAFLELMKVPPGEYELDW